MAFGHLHPRVLAYAIAAAEDAIAEGRRETDAFVELECTLIAATTSGHVPDLPRLIDEDTFKRIWRSCASNPAIPLFKPLDGASMRELRLGCDTCSPLRVTVVADIGTGCITGLAVHGKDEGAYVSMRALARAISTKHSRYRRPPGCLHSWPCEGVPASIDLPEEWSHPSTAISTYVNALGILPEPATTRIDWAEIEETFNRRIPEVFSAPSIWEIARMERDLEAIAVDDLNQRLGADGLTPQRRWLMRIRDRPAKRAPRL